jgi:hypothetical protein
LNEFKLFAHGEAFDVDTFLALSTHRPDHVWRKGDQRRHSCVESLHTTSGVEFLLGDGLVVPFFEQETIAIAYMKACRGELRALAQASGVDAFILGFQYRVVVETDVIGFSLSPSTWLLWHCLDIGVNPVYYVTLDRRSEPEAEEA